MKTLDQLSSEVLKDIKIVFTDIDDTITDEGRLLPEAFLSIWKLASAGIDVIPVTGRPAGWCDCIVRQWPVRGVVGENGAFVVYMENSSLKEFTHPSVASLDLSSRFKEIQNAVFEEVPLARIAKDQPYRRYDLAIDFAEDPPVLGLEDAQKIKVICESFHAIAKISSIHVNTWFGKYDKLSMVKLFSREILGLQEGELKKKSIFCGDSPNDEPMFGYFPLSFGMENLNQFKDLLEVEPTYITNKKNGLGFAEVAEKILGDTDH